MLRTVGCCCCCCWGEAGVGNVQAAGVGDEEGDVQNPLASLTVLLTVSSIVAEWLFFGGSTICFNSCLHSHMQISVTVM